MIGVLAICECGREFLRGIFPQQKCEVCEARECIIIPEEESEEHQQGGKNE